MTNKHIPLPKITPVDKSLKEKIQFKLDNKTKPVGSLGDLEDLALKIAFIQNSTSPILNKPVMLTVAADHHIVDEGVSCAPAEITYQQVINFINGGGAIGLFCKIHNIDLWIADAGVNHVFQPHKKLIDAKVRLGTRNFLKEPAMTHKEVKTAFEKGREIINNFNKQGTNIIGFGEMGIGNTSPASAILSVLTKQPIEICAGKGAGLDSKGIKNKQKVIKQAIENHGTKHSPMEVLRLYGGLEIAMIAGGMYQAALNKMTIIVDGFITSSAALICFYLDKNILDYMIFSHLSKEGAHNLMLDTMGVNPILNLNLRLGEGTGSALAYPIIDTAVKVLTELTSFEESSVFNSSDLTRGDEKRI